METRQINFERGFTLVELMVVVAIIGILAAIAIPQFTQSMDSARVSEGEQTLSKMANGASTYFNADQKCSTSDGAEPWHDTASKSYCSTAGYKVKPSKKTFPGGTSVSGVKSHGSIPANKQKKATAWTGTNHSEILNKFGVSMDEPVLFMYTYSTTSGQGNSAEATLTAEHDFDGGGASGDNHTIKQNLSVSDNTAEVAPAFTENEFK